MGRFGQRPELSQATGMALVRYMLGKFLGSVCHCFPARLDVPTFATRCLHVLHDTRDPSGGKWNCGRECFPVILPKWRLQRHLGIFSMPQIYHMGPTCWEFFSPLKIRWLRPGLNPRAWVLKARTLPVDHRRRLELHTRYTLKTLLSFFQQVYQYCRSQWPRDKRERSKGRSSAEIVVSNPTRGMDVCLLWMLCVVR